VDILIGLIQNVSLILALTFIFRLVSTQSAIQRIMQIPVIQGLVFGLFGIISFLTALPIAPGFFLDSRYIIVVTAGLFLGRLPMLIAAVMIAVVRLGAGGSGTLRTVISLVILVLMIIWLQKHRQKKTLRLTTPILFGIGLAMTLILSVLTILLVGEGGIEIVRITFVPTLLLYPVGMVLIGALFLHEENQIALEARLKESEERFRTVVNNMNDGALLYDHKGQTLVINPSAERILGLSPDRLIGKQIGSLGLEMIHEDGTIFTPDTYPVTLALKTRAPQKNVIMGHYRAKDDLRWMRINAEPVQSGDEFAVLTTLTDITELRRTQEELKRERDLLQTIIDTSPDAIFLKDTEGKVIFSNQAHVEIAAPPDQNMVGKTGFDLFARETAEMIRRDDQQVIASGKPLFNVEQIVINPKNEKRIVLTTKIPWHDPNGNIVGLLAIVRDITELKELETKTMELKSEQQRMLAMQAFINDFSHDFRTPLSIINSETYLLRKTNDEQKREKYLSAIEKQSDRLLHYLDDFLEMTRLDMEDFASKTERIDANTIVQAIIHDVAPEFYEKGLQLTYQLETEALPVQINGVHFGRAVLNLVQNAINYTPSGGSISVQTARVDEQMILTIRDSGIGISESDLPRVFERFYRADKARSASTGGTGLGLSIARKIIEGHQGSIHIDSQVGVGTTVRVTIPLAHAATT